MKLYIIAFLNVSIFISSVIKKLKLLKSLRIVKKFATQTVSIIKDYLI